MAEINEIKLEITKNPNNPANLFSEIRYSVQGNDDDVANERKYREICELIGDDTPGDGQDDALYLVRDLTMQFSGTAVVYVHDTVLDLPKSLYDEDRDTAMPKPDELRARVTLIPIVEREPVFSTENAGVALAPAVITRESNQVVLNAIGPIG